MGGLRHSLPARILVLAPLALMLLLIGCGSSADKITFVSEVDGDAEIYVIDPDSGEATPLTDNHSSDTDPVWSPDGKHNRSEDIHAAWLKTQAGPEDGSGATDEPRQTVSTAAE